MSDYTIFPFLTDRDLQRKKAQKDYTVERKTKKAKPVFLEMHIDKPQCFWENVLFTDETVMEILASHISKWLHKIN